MIQKQSMLEQVELVVNIANHLQVKQVTLVSQFMMAFNLFEARLFDIDKTVRQNLDSIVESAINEGCFSRSDNSKMIAFWVNRYVHDGEMNGHFRNLGIRKDVDKERYATILRALHLNHEIEDRAILDCLLTIAYRFRNNLFHGNKPIEKVSSYNECYEEIIIFIMDLLRKFILANSAILKTR